MSLSNRIAAWVGRENVTFLKHAGNYLSAEVVVGFVGFLSVPILTRLLTTADYGVLGVFGSVVAVTSILLELNFRGAVNRYWLEKKTDFQDFLATTLVFLAVLTVFNLGIIWLFRLPIARFVGLEPNVFYLAILCASLKLPWNLNWKLLVAQQRSKRYARFRMINVTSTFAIGITWIYLLSSDRFMGQIYAMLTVGGLLGIWLTVWLVGQAKGGKFKRKHLVYALTLGVPLIPHALSGFVLNLFDRVIINQLEGNSSAGLYTFAYDVGSVMHVSVNAMNQSWLPIFMEHRRKKEFGIIERLASTYAKYIYFIALSLVLFSEEVVLIMAGKEFQTALPMVPVIVFGFVGVFLYTLYSNYSFYAKKTWLISIATVIAGAANVALNYWAIPIWGAIAAAWTTFASYMLLFVCHYIIAKFVIKEPVMRLRSVIPWFLITVGLSVAFTLAQQALNNYLLVLLALKIPIVAATVGLIVWSRKKSDRKTNEKRKP